MPAKEAEPWWHRALQAGPFWRGSSAVFVGPTRRTTTCTQRRAPSWCTTTPGRSISASPPRPPAVGTAQVPPAGTQEGEQQQCQDVQEPPKSQPPSPKSELGERARTSTPGAPISSQLQLVLPRSIKPSCAPAAGDGMQGAEAILGSSVGVPGAVPGVARRGGSPASRKVMRQVSLGMKSFRRDPLKTYSTTASERPARCRKGRNCFAFWVSCGETGGQRAAPLPQPPPWHWCSGDKVLPPPPNPIWGVGTARFASSTLRPPLAGTHGPKIGKGRRPDPAPS